LESTEEYAVTLAASVADQGEPDDADARLAAVLADQPEDIQARYQYRRPAETLAFFGIEPGMTVMEALPGGGWYTRILLPYLGEDGQLIGANYPADIYRLFGFMTEEQIAAQETWVADWTARAEGWRGEGDAAVAAFAFGSLPEELRGTADAALLIRALHNLARFEDEGGFLTTALANVHAVLKPGGIVGVVQHEARPEMPDDWASGDAAYLKRSFVIGAFESAGFEFVEASDINANPLDQPTTEDSVWRLPPSLRGSDDDDELRARMQAIGESHRMTLKFRKPAG
ncbi:MAG: class I SAM-dependent methyltransferase, partial [Pseudomonadales bacterium]